jgi:hypothetical protein
MKKMVEGKRWGKSSQRKELLNNSLEAVDRFYPPTTPKLKFIGTLREAKGSVS